MRAWLTYGVIIVVSLIGGFVGYVVYRMPSSLLPKPSQAVHQPQSANVVIRSNPTMGNVFLHDDPEVGTAPVPSVHLLKRDPSGVETEVITDSRGLRVSSFGAPEPVRVDILAIGCSQTWGQGVSNDQTFTALAGKQLGATVANAAVHGHGGVGALLMLRRHQHLQPKVVVYGFFQDHLKRNLNPCGNYAVAACMPTPSVGVNADGRPFLREIRAGQWDLWFPITSRMERVGKSFGIPGTFVRELSFTSYVISQEIQSKFSSLAMDALYNPRFQEDPFVVVGQTHVEPRDPELFAQMVKAAQFVLGEMKKTSDSIGATFIVVYIPTFYGEVPVDMPPQIAEIARTLHIPIIDSSRWMNDLIKTHRSHELVVPNDGHLSVYSHAQISQELVELLRNSPWLSDRQPRG